MVFGFWQFASWGRNQGNRLLREPRVGQISTVVDTEGNRSRKEEPWEMLGTTMLSCPHPDAQETFAPDWPRPLRVGNGRLSLLA